MADLFLIVRLGGERVALPAEQVEAVVETGPLTPVPGAPSHVAGLCALRSRVLTVIDCLASLDPALSLSGRETEAVATQVGGHGYALLVEGVEDVAEAESQGPADLPLEPRWRRVATGTVEAGGDLLLLLDVGALVAGCPAQAARAA